MTPPIPGLPGTRALPAGLSAFPLTPLRENVLDTDAFTNLITRLAGSGVDSITALGSTGSYAYLSRAERATAATIAVQHAGDVPVIVGIGALRTSDVAAAVHDAQHAGAAGVLLAPVSYQPLTDEDVYGLYETITAQLSVPLIVYDNPATTRFTFTDDLHARIAALPQVTSIKIPALPADPDQAAARVAALRGLLPDHVSIGISGDASAAAGLAAGCSVWYSVIAGTLPHLAVPVTRAAQAGDHTGAAAAAQNLQPVWDLFARHGSLRVTAAIAEHLGLADRSCLPLPIRGLNDHDREDVAAVLRSLEVQ